MTDIAIAKGFSLPIDYATSTGAILAKKGAGKSNAAVVMAEQMYRAGVPWVAVDPKGDWWGMRSSADGKGPGLPIVVFGGRHGDLPLEPTAGSFLADLVLAERLTCVLDVSEFSRADVRRFLLAFADRLYRQADADPMHLFLEEAHEYLPQMVRGDDAPLVGAWQRIVKQGRFKGLGVTLISQRSASVNKDVLTQVDTLIMMRTTSPQDRNAVKAWIDVHGDSDDVLATLPSLAAGEAWVWAPEWNMLKRIQFSRRSTFDSGATPKVGQVRKAPATLADVDLARIKEQMTETIEKAKADDPRELRKTITRLQRELEQARQDSTPAAPEIVIDGSVLTAVNATINAFTKDLLQVGVAEAEVSERTARSRAELWEKIKIITEALSDLRQDVLGARPAGDGARAVAHTPAADRAAQRPDPPKRRDESRAPVPRSAPAADVDLPTGEAKILAAVAHKPGGVTAQHLAVLTGYKRSSRNTYLQRLRTRGFIVNEGGRIRATADGIAALGDIEPLPTGDALRDYWLTTLPTGEAAILALLIDAGDAGVTFDALDDATGYKRSSRNTYLQRLRSRELITTNDGTAYAGAELIESINY